MPIIEHSTIPMPPAVDFRAERVFVSPAQGALSLTVKEVDLHPGWTGCCIPIRWISPLWLCPGRCS